MKRQAKTCKASSWHRRRVDKLAAAGVAERDLKRSATAPRNYRLRHGAAGAQLYL